MELRSFSFLLLVSVLISCSNNPNHQEETTKTQTPAPQRSSRFIPEDSLKAFIESAPAVSKTETALAPFDSITWNKVIAYEYDGKNKENASILSNGKFDTSVRKQTSLNEAQVKQVTDCLGSPASYGGGTRSCFIPGQAFVFYNNSTPVMIVDICLDCNNLVSSVRIPAQFATHSKDKKFPVQLNGFSEKGRQCIIDLSKELDFSYGKYEAVMKN